MGVIIDTSIFIAAERGRFDWPGFNTWLGREPLYLTVITFAELMHGAGRADTQERRAARLAFIADVEAQYPLLTFGRDEAVEYSALWVTLSIRGALIGTHDLQIAAIARRFDYRVATLNSADFYRVDDLDVIDASSFRLERSRDV